MLKHLNIPSVRYTGPSEALIKTVAIIGGAGIGFETSAFKREQMFSLLET